MIYYVNLYVGTTMDCFLFKQFPCSIRMKYVTINYLSINQFNAIKSVIEVYKRP